MPEFSNAAKFLFRLRLNNGFAVILFMFIDL